MDNDIVGIRSECAEILEIAPQDSTSGLGHRDHHGVDGGTLARKGPQSPGSPCHSLG